MKFKTFKALPANEKAIQIHIETSAQLRYQKRKLARQERKLRCD